MPKKGNKQWLHPADALLKGHILYTVKFLGECSVEEPKGTDVVKSAITKMKFNKHIKRAEGQKLPKVELVISAEAVKVLDPKTRMVLHQYPLHRISYCADDKSDKRMFTFIGKDANSNDHYCYVFDSEKCAEEIILTIGQAFDLAYKRFLETSQQETDIKKQYQVLQKRVQSLQQENEALRKRVSELEKLKDRSDIADYMKSNQSQIYSTVVGRRLENLMLNEDASSTPSSQTNGTHHNPFSTPSPGNAPPMLSPPPVNTRTLRAGTKGNSGPNTPTSSSNFFPSPAPAPAGQIDPFGMEAFNPVNSTFNTTPSPDQELMDIQAGFSRGLAFGTDDFNLADLDPLNNRT